MRPPRGTCVPLKPLCAVDARRGCRGRSSPPGRIHRGGAGEARGAHNPEDIGSSPISGIYLSSALKKRRGACAPSDPSPCAVGLQGAFVAPW